jgi:hypothetical protein
MLMTKYNHLQLFQIISVLLEMGDRAKSWDGAEFLESSFYYLPGIESVFNRSRTAM